MNVFADIPVWVWIAVAAVLGFAAGRVSAPEEDNTQRRANAEANLASLSMNARERAEAALEKHRKIEAVGIVREDLGVGLRDSKDVVDALARQRRGLGG